MNLRTIYRYASNRTMHRFLIYFLTIILCCVMFLLLLISWYVWGYVRHERYLCNKSLNGGLQQCGMLALESDQAYDPDFLSEILEMEEIVGLTCGYVYPYPVDEITEFGEQQKKLDPEYFENNGTVQWFHMNSFGVGVCHFDLQEGKHPKEWELKEDEVLIYLGGAFENVTVGEKFESPREPITYVVGGILKKGCNWIDDSVYCYGTIQDSPYVQCLDNMVVCLESQLVSGRNTYCVQKGYRIEEVEGKMMQLAEKYDADITLARLETVLDENEYQLSIVLNVIRLLTILVVLTSLIVLERTQYAEIINDTEYFGIFYANGATTRDLIAILLVENLLKIVVSFVVAMISGYCILRLQWTMFQPGIEQWNTAKSVYFGQAVIPSVLIGVGLVALSTTKSILWIKKKRPVELLQNYKV